MSDHLFYRLMDNQEKKIILWAVKKTGCIADAAGFLGITRTSLQMKVKRLNLNEECAKIKKEFENDNNLHNSRNGRKSYRAFDKTR